MTLLFGYADTWNGREKGLFVPIAPVKAIMVAWTLHPSLLFTTNIDTDVAALDNRKRLQRSMPVTLKDVAREAGVSISTACRALNNSFGIHDDTRRQITDAAARLNYRTNQVARSLVTGQSHSIGLVISDIRNPFFAEVARGAEDATFRAGWDLVLCNSDLDAEKQMHYLKWLVSKRIDGIVMNSVAPLEPAQQDQLWAAGVPIVL